MNGIKAFDLKDADEAILKKIFLLNESYAPFLGPLETVSYTHLTLPTTLVV